MALPAVGTTITHPQTPECLQLIEGDTKEDSFCTSFQPPPNYNPSLCCGTSSTSSNIEKHAATPIKPAKMQNDSLSLLVHLLSFQHYSMAAIIDNPQEMRSNYLKTPTAMILEQSPSVPALIAIATNQCCSNSAVWQPLASSSASLPSPIYTFYQSYTHQSESQASPEQLGNSSVDCSIDANKLNSNSLPCCLSIEWQPVDLHL